MQTQAPSDVEAEQRAALRAARETLRAHDFDDDPVRRSLHGAVPASIGPTDAPFYDGQLAGPEALRLLVRLFILGEVLPRNTVRRVLGAGLQPLVLAQLLGESETEVSARVRAEPYREQLVVSASPTANASGDIPGVEPSTMTLAALTPRTSVHAVLDLGTGVGVQALLAAPHAARIIATDLNADALRFARLNVALAGATNIESRQGSWYEPVNGQRFDLILGNLPFAIAPAATSPFEHCHEDPCGDTASRTAVEGAPTHLVAGGTAVFLISWRVDDPERWHEPVWRWLPERGIDAVVLRHGLRDARGYVADHLHHLRRAQPQAYTDASRMWLDAFRSAGLQRIAWGALILRAHTRTGASRMHAFKDVTWPGAYAGDAVRTLLAAFDILAGAGSDGLPAEHLARADGLVASHASVPVGGSLNDAPVIVERQGGTGVQARVSRDALRLLESLEGPQRLSDIIQRQKLDAGGRSTIRRDARALVAAGFLIPSQPS